MNLSKTLFGIICASLFLAQTTLAETCCQKAAAEGKECKDKCCIAAHKDGKSCAKCNPNKEDLKLKKAQKKTEKSDGKK
jgi:hypothetical protein